MIGGQGLRPSGKVVPEVKNWGYGRFEASCRPVWRPPKRVLNGFPTSTPEPQAPTPTCLEGSGERRKSVDAVDQRGDGSPHLDPSLNTVPYL